MSAGLEGSALDVVTRTYLSGLPGNLEVVVNILQGTEVLKCEENKNSIQRFTKRITSLMKSKNAKVRYCAIQVCRVSIANNPVCLATDGSDWINSLIKTIQTSNMDIPVTRKAAIFTMVDIVNFCCGKMSFTRQLLTPKLPALINALYTSMEDRNLIIPSIVALKTILKCNSTTFRPHANKLHEKLKWILQKPGFLKSFSKAERREVYCTFASLYLAAPKGEEEKEWKLAVDQVMTEIVYTLKLSLPESVLEASRNNDDDLLSMFVELLGNNNEVVERSQHSFTMDFSKLDQGLTRSELLLVLLQDNFRILMSLLATFISQPTPVMVQVELLKLTKLVRLCLNLHTKTPRFLSASLTGDTDKLLSVFFSQVQKTGLFLLNVLLTTFRRGLLQYIPDIAADLEYFVSLYTSKGPKRTRSITFDVEISTVTPAILTSMTNILRLAGQIPQTGRDTLSKNSAVRFLVTLCNLALSTVHVQLPKLLSSTSKGSNILSSKEASSAMSDVISNPELFVLIPKTEHLELVCQFFKQIILVSCNSEKKQSYNHFYSLISRFAIITGFLQSQKRVSPANGDYFSQGFISPHLQELLITCCMYPPVGQTASILPIAVQIMGPNDVLSALVHPRLPPIIRNASVDNKLVEESPALDIGETYEENEDEAQGEVQDEAQDDSTVEPETKRLKPNPESSEVPEVQVETQKEANEVTAVPEILQEEEKLEVETIELPEDGRVEVETVINEEATREITMGNDIQEEVTVSVNETDSNMKYDFASDSESDGDFEIPMLDVGDSDSDSDDS